jgi:hypothetical protein
VALLPQLLHLRNPERDTVLYPAVSYPTYAMGATLAGCRAVPVPVDKQWRIDLGAIVPADARRALALWVNTPGNPAGGLDDLDAAAAWGRAQGVPVFSDECYIEFTWNGPGRTILRNGNDGLVAVHSLSKRSNLAGARAGFYAGDAELVHYLSEVRKHIGLMVCRAGRRPRWRRSVTMPTSTSSVVATRRLERMIQVLAASASRPRCPRAASTRGFRPGGDAWGLTRAGREGRRSWRRASSTATPAPDTCASRGAARRSHRARGHPSRAVTAGRYLATMKRRSERQRRTGAARCSAPSSTPI